MSRFKRRFLSGFVAVLMVFTMMPVGSLLAFGDDLPTADPATTETTAAGAITAASEDIVPLADPVLSVYTKRGDEAPVLAKAYLQTELDALERTTSLGYLVNDAGTRKVVGTNSSVPLTGSGSIITTAGTTFIAGDQIILSDSASNSVTLTYQDLNGTLAFFPDSADGADPLPITTTQDARGRWNIAAPTVTAPVSITLKYGLEDIRTSLADTRSVAIGNEAPGLRLVYGTKVNIDKNGIGTTDAVPNLSSFLDDVKTVTVVKPTLSDVTVNTRYGSDAPVLNKVFKPAELQAKATNSKLGFLQTGSGVTSLQATDKWIKLQDLITAAGATFETGDTVTFTAIDGYAVTMTYKTITEGKYFYPATTAGTKDAAGAIEVGAVFALRYITTGGLTSTAAADLAALNFATDLRMEQTGRFYRGSSLAEYNGEGVPGNQFPSSPITITVNKPFKVLSGSNRYDTAAQSALLAYPEGAEGVIIANGTGTDKVNGKYADALAASTLAGILDYPVLLTEKDSLPAATIEALKTLKPKTAVVLGDSNSISYSVQGQLNDYADSVPRKAGANRIATSVAIYNYAKQVKPAELSKTAIFADAFNYPDALAIAPYAAYTKSQIFLVTGNALSAEVAKVFTTANFDKAIIVGDNTAVSAAIETQINKVISSKAVRLGGKDRYVTSALIAQYSVDNVPDLTFNNVGIATGLKFPDALSGAPLLSKNKAVLLLTADHDVSALDLLATNKDSIQNVNIFGDTNSVSPKVHRIIESKLGWNSGTIK